MMEWSEIFPEVLDIIAQKYITCYEEYSSFACVCKSWRLAATRTYPNSNGPPSRLPSLVLADKSYNQESHELFLLSNKSIRKIRLPEAYGKQCMSSCGWLLTFEKDFASQLINPLSREIINLPNLNTFLEPIHPRNWCFAIKRVVLLMESKLVFVIGGSNNKLGFCHIGDNKWTFVEPHKRISDVTFHNGRVYCFDGNNNILACNVNGKDPKVLVDVATMPTMPRSYFHQDVSKAYIVGLDDDKRKQLLVIFKEVILCHWKCPRIVSFKAVAYDLESGNFSEVKDFGYMDQLHALGKSYDNDMAINLINRSLNKDFGDFVRNFNMHCVGKTVTKLHALLIDYEKGLKDKPPTPQVLTIQKGRANKPKPDLKRKGNCLMVNNICKWAMEHKQ
nr:hypothetical protein [Tanacetum cinerariifolium]